MVVPIWAAVLFGFASWYSLPGQPMADGKPFDPSRHICATMTQPLGSRLEVFNASNGKTSWCIAEDRGPDPSTGRILDVSPAVRDDIGLQTDVSKIIVYRVLGHVPHCHHRPAVQTCDAPPPLPCVISNPKPAILECK